MSAHTEVTLAALENQAFALMGRMHVILRRQNGRVTDIEYMRTDPTYCRHLLDMAERLPNEDLQQICEKLNDVFFGEQGLFVREKPSPPLLTRLGIGGSTTPIPAKTGVDARIDTLEPAIKVATLASTDTSVDRTYIGRLR